MLKPSNLRRNYAKALKATETRLKPSKRSLLARLLMEPEGDRRICALPDLLAHLGEGEGLGARG